ncbi:YuzD family protein [Bacillus sp. 2205SS5-2]|uniref:YuzD family protein n=1 Tax=Bacillus sp. 2205SS5-2 TaxID=3109031 RepID=UPI0030053F23
MKKKAAILVYGAEQICPSCVGMPSTKETYEWLQAAISRKFPDQPFAISYIDIYDPSEDGEKKAFSLRVIEEDLFYPVVVLDGNIVAEGNPRLKTIFAELEKLGYVAT